jgi:hypothetical protein
VCSGPDLALRVTAWPDRDETTLYIGLFFVQIFLSSSFLKMEGNEDFTERRYGFSFHHNALWWEWNARDRFGNNIPFWRRTVIHFDELLFGKPLAVSGRMNDVENVYFMLGNKEFKINEIKWTEHKRFRSYIPFNLYHETYIRCNIKIESPPKRLGKGENSWDCDDDGTYEMSYTWEHNVPPHHCNQKECMELAVKDYVDSFKEDAKRYGSGRGPDGASYRDEYVYIGRKLEKILGSCQEECATQD